MRGLHRRAVLGELVVTARASKGRAASAQDRSAIVEGAKREGVLAFATSVSAAGFPRFLEAFRAKHPASTSAAATIPPRGGGGWHG